MEAAVTHPPLPEPLATHWARVSSGQMSAEQLQDALYAATGGFTMRVHDVELRVDFANRLEPVVALLRSIEPLGLAAAPVVVATWADAHDMVLVTRHPACAGEALEPVRDRPVTSTAKTRFRADVARLYEAGFDHPYIARGLAHWRVSEITGTLVVDTWDVARARPPESVDASLAQVEDLLARLPEA
jgi:hypothetical protein